MYGALSQPEQISLDHTTYWNYHTLLKEEVYECISVYRTEISIIILKIGIPIIVTSSINFSASTTQSPIKSECVCALQWTFDFITKIKGYIYFH